MKKPTTEQIANWRKKFESRLSFPQAQRDGLHKDGYLFRDIEYAWQGYFRAMTEQEARIAELAPWKDAVIDALAVCCGDCAIGTPPSDVLKLIASINQQFTEQNCKDREDERIAALTKDAEPYAYVRKWHFDGEKPAKVKNENNRWAWPTKFKFVSLSFPKCQPDDVPLYTHPPAPDYTDLLKMIAHRARSFPNFPLGHHITEVFAAIGEEPPEPAPKAITPEDVTDEMVKTSVFVNVFNAKQQIANVVNAFNGVKP